MVSTARIAYIFYAVLKVAGYSLLTYILLDVFAGDFGPVVPGSFGPDVSRPGVRHTILILSKKSLEMGFNRLRSLDLCSGVLRGSTLSSRGPSSTRPDLYVFARIVKTLKEKGAMNRTALAAATGLSYDRLVRYLDWMTEKGFVRLDEEGQVQLTSSGSEAYDGIVRWIVDHVGSLKLSRVHSGAQDNGI